MAGVGVVVGLLAFPLAADDGDLDPSFDGGAFTLGWTAGHARATALEPIAGGGLLVGGTVGASAGEIDGWAVAKLEADGTRDLAWALAFEIVSAVDEAPLGTETLFDLGRDDQERTLLAGAAGDGVAGSPPMLARLTPGGALDTVFDGNGIRVVDDAPAGWQDIRTTAAIVLADGRSVFVGSCEDCPLAGDDQVWVTRRLADGAPDPAFSTDGWHSFRFAEGGNPEPTAVAVDSGGRIVVGGIVSDPPFADLYLARLTPAGALVFADGFEGATTGAWAGE